MTEEELITETRVSLQNQSAQSHDILKRFHYLVRREGYLDGYNDGSKNGYQNAQKEVADWITAEKVRNLWEGQK